MVASKDYHAGRRKYSEIRGEKGAKESVEGLTKIFPDYGQISTEFVWGKVWTREGLDYRTRELVTIAVLMVSGKEERAREHIGDALRNGIEKEEVLELMLHLAAYAGFPTATNGVQIVGEVAAEASAGKQ